MHVGLLAIVSPRAFWSRTSCISPPNVWETAVLCLLSMGVVLLTAFAVLLTIGVLAQPSGGQSVLANTAALVALPLPWVHTDPASRVAAILIFSPLVAGCLLGPMVGVLMASQRRFRRLSPQLRAPLVRTATLFALPGCFAWLSLLWTGWCLLAVLQANHDPVRGAGIVPAVMLAVFAFVLAAPVGVSVGWPLARIGVMSTRHDYPENSEGSPQCRYASAISTAVLVIGSLLLFAAAFTVR
jgi:hypothetical protein